MIERNKERITVFAEEELSISGYLKVDMDDFRSMEGDPYAFIRESHCGKVEDLARMITDDITEAGADGIRSVVVLIRSNSLTMAELSVLDSELHRVLGKTSMFRRGIAMDGTLAPGESSVAVILFA